MSRRAWRWLAGGATALLAAFAYALFTESPYDEEGDWL